MFEVLKDGLGPINLTWWDMMRKRGSALCREFLGEAMLYTLRKDKGEVIKKRPDELTSVTSVCIT